jgi:ABC-2 type transport system ATP-binding protein
MTDDEYVIQAESVSKHFGHIRAVQNLTLGIPKGEIFCLLGPSGSGKTTTIRMMLGVYVPDSGTLTVFGRPVKAIGKALHHRIGYMPQFFVLYPTLTVQENLNFVGMLYDLGLKHRRRRIRELLEFLGLWPHRHETANRISGGMQRRLALAAALIHEPDLLFLDEPTAGIAPILRTKLWEEFHRLNEAGTTLVVTTQYVVEAEYGDQVAILSAGELAALGSPHELRQRALGGETIEIRTTGEKGFTASLMEALRNCACMVKAESPSYDLLRLTVADSALGWGFLISALSQRESQAVQLSMILLLSSVFFSGFFLDLDSLIRPVRFVSYSMPVTYAIAGFQEIMLAGRAPIQWHLFALAGLAGGIDLCRLAALPPPVPPVVNPAKAISIPNREVLCHTSSSRGDNEPGASNARPTPSIWPIAILACPGTPKHSPPSS